MQQGDPLGPLFFALVLHKVVSVIDADDECIDLRFRALVLGPWMMEYLAGTKSLVLRASILSAFGYFC